MSEKIVQLYEEVIKSQLMELVRGSVEETLNELLEAEPEKLTRAARYERNEQRQGYRSGHYNRNLTTTSGDVTLKVPKLKGISFETAIVERYRRRESSVEEALIEMYLAGVSVRRVEDITEALWGSKVSPSTISELNKKAYVHIEDWRNRSLQGGRYPYVYVDGIYLRRNWGGEFENIAILVAIAVNEDGYREVLGAAEGMKGDKASWVSFFQWLRGCGLDGVKLIVGDKCLGMLEAVGEVFSEGKYQRCTLPHRGKASESVPPICSCVHLNLHNDFINLGSQNFLRGHDLGDLGVERHNVDLLPGVLGLHIGGDREVILLPGNLLVTGQMGEVGLLGAAGESVHNTVDVLGCQLIVVGHLDTLFGGVDEQGLAVRLVLFQHHDAGGDAGAEKQVAGQLDHAVDEVVANEILEDLLLRPAPVQDARETDDGGGAVGRQPTEAVHDKGQIRLAFGGQHASGSKAGVIDEQGVSSPAHLME